MMFFPATVTGEETCIRTACKIGLQLVCPRRLPLQGRSLVIQQYHR